MQKSTIDYLRSIGLDQAGPEMLRSWADRIIRAQGVGYSQQAVAAANEIKEQK